MPTGGLSMGSAMAMILSFGLDHSIWWMNVHGVCSWFYVICGLGRAITDHP
jgi:hypothetical protein